MAHTLFIPQPPVLAGRGRRGLAVAASALYGLFAVSSAALGGPILCPWRRCTGTACPGCGASRAAWELAQGNVVMSLRFHPLVLAFLAQLTVAGILGLSDRSRAFLIRHLTTILIVNGVVLVAAWFVRWRLGLLDVILAS